MSKHHKAQRFRIGSAVIIVALVCIGAWVAQKFGSAQSARSIERLELSSVVNLQGQAEPVVLSGWEAPNAWSAAYLPVGLECDVRY